MSRVTLCLVLIVAVLSLIAAPLAAAATDSSPVSAVDRTHLQEGEDEPAGAANERRDGLDDVVIWSLVSLGIFAALMGALYFFKREVGGFPENPSWVAPITIMRSEDFPGEGDFGEQAPSGQARAEH